MERKIIFRERQEFQAADVNNVQTFADEALQHLIHDTLTRERMIFGLEVTAKSATEIDIAVGRYYVGDEGKVYRKDQVETKSVFSFLPVVDKRYLLAVVKGETVEHDIQPRDFLIDIQTGQTEPQAVPMEEKRHVVVSLVSGVESPDPQPPAVPTGQTEIARILLDPSGIVEITQNDNVEIPNLFLVDQRLGTVELWQERVQAKVVTLTSDIAALSKQIKMLENQSSSLEMARDIARTKTMLQLPDDWASYGQDYFIDLLATDDDHIDYLALTEEGARFPWTAMDEKQPALFNPYEETVKKIGGFVIPDYTEQVLLNITSNYAGGLDISQYQFETVEIRQGKITVERTRYGPVRRVCTNARAYRANPELFLENLLGTPIYQVVAVEQGAKWIRVQGIFIDRVQVPYSYADPTTSTINGSQIAQTFWNAENTWRTSIGLYFTSVAEDGVLHVAVCEVERGKPNLEKTVASTQVNPNNMNTYPQETKIQFPRPFLLEAGKRYAILLITGGNHHIATVSGQEYTQGTLFYSLDGEYFQGDFTKNLMMKHYYAEFKRNFVTVELEPASLNGGIADIALTVNGFTPEGTEKLFEYQIDGNWYPIVVETADQLLGLPSMLPMRVTFVGSTTIAPAMDLAGSRLQVARPGTSFVHISTERTLPSNTPKVEVQLRLEYFDEGYHTCECKLMTANGTLEPDLTEDVEEYDPDPTIDPVRRRFVFDDIDPQINSYVVRIEGTTTNALVPFLVAERFDIAY